MPKIITNDFVGAAGKRESTPKDLLNDLGKTTGFQNLGSQINRITVVRLDDVREAHWELFLHCGATVVKVDLMEAGYRVLYGATLRVGVVPRFLPKMAI